MHARRLVAAPTVALVAVLLVGAVIDTGQRTRDSRIDRPKVVAEDPSISAERLRIAEAEQAGDACTGALECTADRKAGRLRAASSRVAQWPADARFEPSRLALQARLETEAAVLDQRAAMSVDGVASVRERERLEQLESAALRAARHAIDVQLAVGLLTRAEHTTELGSLLDEAAP